MMRHATLRRCVLVVAALCLGLLWRPASAADPARLVVMVVLDGFRAEFLDTYASHWRRGFRTLLAEGARFRNTRYPYLTTDTCAGHFTISTGVLPYRHGLVVDDWYDRALGRQVECTHDEDAKPIGYGVQATTANSAKNLSLPTLADRLRSERPGSRVVTVSLKARGSIGLAGHGGDAVTWWDDAVDGFVTSTAYASSAVPAVKAFLDANSHQRDLDATWTLRDPEGTYRNRDAGLGERPPAGWGALFPHTLRGVRGADGQFATQWQRSGFVNAYLGRFALALVDAFGLGRGQGTDFLGVSFTGTDRVAHGFGPDSREYEDVVARMDDVLGDLVESLDVSVGRANYVLMLTADHGVTSIPSIARGTGRVVNEDVRDRIEETLLSRYGPLPEGVTHVESSVWGGYVLRPATAARVASDPDTVRAVRRVVEAIPGVERLIHTPTITLDARDPLLRSAALGGANMRRGEFLLSVARGWTYMTRNSGEAIHHSTGQDYNQHVPLVFLGGGIAPGRYDVAVSPIDIAPTLAALAGVTMPTADGRVLPQVYRTQPVPAR